ncbi:MAG: PD-(D/E)XK nuclease family protein [Acidimicrobiaceae bacterium]|nr:PD-(D/E)XK nuclease family protein [Acidimicrobiaceae bacterium]
MADESSSGASGPTVNTKIGLICTAFGPPAHRALAEAVAAAKAGDCLAPVTVVVPSNYVGLAARRALACQQPQDDQKSQDGRRRAAGGIAAVTFLTAHRLAERLAATSAATEKRRGASSAVIASTVRVALRRNPGHFQGVENHPATETALARAHRELSELTDAQLDKLGGESLRARDVVRIHRQVASGLDAAGFTSATKLAATASALVRAAPAQAHRELGPVIVFLPHSFTRTQTLLLRALADTVGVKIIAGLTGAQDADAAVWTCLQRLGVSQAAARATLHPELSSRESSSDDCGSGVTCSSAVVDEVRRREPSVDFHGDGATLNEGAVEPPDGASPDSDASLSRETPVRGTSGGEVRAMSVSDADDEVRHAVRAVVDEARKGTPLGRCAVLYGLDSPYARLLGDALDTAGIPRCGSTVRTVATSLLGRSLLEMLALADSDPAGQTHGRGFSRRAVMAWLAGAPISVRLADHRSSEASADTAGAASDTTGEAPTGTTGDASDATGDANDTTHAADGTAGAVSAGSEWQSAPTAAWERVARAARVEAGIDSWQQRLERYAADRRDEAGRLQGDDEQSWRAESLRRSAGRADELRSFITELHSDLHPPTPLRSWVALSKWCQDLVHKYLGGRNRSSWPDDEREMAGRVDQAIQGLRELDSTGEPASAAVFQSALRHEIESSSSRHGRLGGGVLVGPVSLAVGLELDLAVVCGMAEGAFPARRSDDTLLPDRERRAVGHDLPARSDRSGDDHRALLAVLAAANETLLLCPRGDLRRAADRSPSRWLLDYAGEPEVVPSFVAGLRRTAFPAHAQEHDTRCMLDWHDARGRDAGRWSELDQIPGVRHRPELRRGIEMRRARVSSSLTRFDGNLTAGRPHGAELELPRPDEDGSIVSASRLELWARCPHAYFMRYVLKVDPVDDAEDDHRISPLERGSLVHRILELWLSEAISEGDVPEHDRPWPEARQARLLELAAKECDAFAARGLVGRRLYWQHDRRQIVGDLVRFLEFDDEQRARHLSKPAKAELGFGLPGSASGPVSIDIADGRSVNVRGAIDRIDTTVGGGLLVIDYKTGSSEAHKSLSLDDPTLGGRHLQLVLYDLAARALLDVPEDASSQGAYWFVSTKGQFRDAGYRADEARRQVLEAVNTIIDGIGDGLFPLHPDEPSGQPWVSCGFCDPDGLGTRDQWRDWQRKQADPDLARYLDLIDPEREQPQTAGQAAGATP